MKPTKEGTTELETGAVDLELPSYGEDGVDLTLIRRTLLLTPAERLNTLQQFVRAVESLRGRNPHA
jgi:hypothetical protein